MKTSELSGAALDWAVAKCEGAGSALVDTHSRGIVLLLSDATSDCEIGETYSPSTAWAQGGPIIEREGINLDNYAKNPRWSAWTPAPERESGEAQAYGPTPLVAAMRCYVVSKLGDEVEVPDELMEAA